jgi:hypothetical protein
MPAIPAENSAASGMNRIVPILADREAGRTAAAMPRAIHHQQSGANAVIGIAWLVVLLFIVIQAIGALRIMNERKKPTNPGHPEASLG